MKFLTPLMAGAALIALTPDAAVANGSDMSFAVHDIIVTSNIPAVNISVRNLSPSPNPALRNLRVTSQTPVLNVAGQVWCKSFQNAHTRADAARVMFGNAVLASSHDGVDVISIGVWSSSPVAPLGGDETLRNYNINAPVNFPDHWTGGVTLGFNPVRVVEERMAHYVENGAGSQADFLRVDDVFVTTITMNAVGWCEYESQNIQGRYAGVRSIEVPVHIFYHGDPDIEDPVVAVGVANTIQGPAPVPGPSYAPAPTPAGGTPPSRLTTPVRAGDTGTIRPQGGEEAALLLPAVQQVREPALRDASQGGVFVAAGDIDGDAAAGLLLPAVQRAQEPAAAEGEERPCSMVEDTIRREAARAAVGLLLGSSRSSRSSRGFSRESNRDRMVNDAVDRVAGC